MLVFHWDLSWGELCLASGATLSQQVREASSKRCCPAAAMISGMTACSIRSYIYSYTLMYAWEWLPVQKGSTPFWTCPTFNFRCALSIVSLVAAGIFCHGLKTAQGWVALCIASGFFHIRHICHETRISFDLSANPRQQQQMSTQEQVASLHAHGYLSAMCQVCP